MVLGAIRCWLSVLQQRFDRCLVTLHAGLRVEGSGAFQARASDTGGGAAR